MSPQESVQTESMTPARVDATVGSLQAQIVGEASPPSVDIVVPPIPVPVDVPFNVGINADPGTSCHFDPVIRQVVCDEPAVIYQGGFRLQFDTGEVATSASVGTPASVTLNRAGIHVGTASASTQVGGVVKSSPSQFVAGAPTVAVTAPAQQNPPISIPLGEAGADITITATTTKADWFGGLKVTARDNARPPVDLSAMPSPDAASTIWQGSLHLDPMPLGNHLITVVAGASVYPQLTGTATVTITAVDKAAPHLAVSHPASGGKVVVDASRTVHLNGTCTDPQSGMSTGAATVAVALSSGGPFVTAVPGTGNDFSQWSATVTAPDLGPFVVYLGARDAAGNTTDILPWPLEAISDYVPASLADRLSDTEYLSAVMAFARDMVTRPGGQATSADLTAAIQQPVDRMSQPLSGAAIAGLVPVNELRIPVELLRARIAGANIPQDPGRQGEADYLQAANQMLLSAAGTSYEEMRRARGADPAARAALATRLGIALYGPVGSTSGRPDQLDALTLDGAALTEAELERLFGLPQTTSGLDPLRSIPQSQLLTWQLSTQTSQWQLEDLSAAAVGAAAVLVDPDVITISDIRPGSALSTRIGQLLGARTTALTGQAATLAAAVAGAADAAGKLSALLAAGIPGGTPAMLTGWHDQDVQGIDISTALAEAGLDRTGYKYLLSIQSLVAVAEPTAQEWDDAVQVLTGAFRRRQYSTWRSEESGIILSPEFFSAAESGPTVGPLRINPNARTAWQSILLTRLTRRENLVAAAAAVVSAAEQRALPILRDALLADVQATVRGDAGEFLTGLYQVDFRAGGAETTTRMGQATASLQTLLELVRSGDVSKDSLARAWTMVDNGAFDEAWTWMGGIESWRRATTAFLFPEAALDPSMLDPDTDPGSGSSPEFHTLVTSLQGLAGSGSPAEVDKCISTYKDARAAWLNINKPPSEPGPLIYRSGRNRDHQNSLAKWSAFLLARGDAPSIAAAREIFWAVPILAAQRLLAAGHYQDALDWLWVAYPYNDPKAVSSYARINTEVQNAPAQPDLTFPPNWTRDLNPFHLVDAAGGRPAPYLRNTLLTLILGLIDYGNSVFSTDTDASLAHARTLYLTAGGLLAHPRFSPVKPSSPGEAALALPQLDILALRVQTQLAKVRNGRNIAGLPRVVSGAPGSGDAIRQPTPYHFRVLLARAQQTAQQAGQLEAYYLSLLEKYDNGALKLGDAEFAAGIAGLQSKVHEARVQEATDATTAADTQKTKADTMEETYLQRMQAPPNQYETALLNQYGQMRDLQDVVSVANGAIATAQAAAQCTDWWAFLTTFGGKNAAGSVALGATVVKTGAEVWINNLQSQMQANQLRSGIETRREDAAVQHASAVQDVLVAAAQQTVAQDQVTIAKAEQDVAAKQNEQALATLALLRSQFTSPDLYLWMSDTLGSVHRYFLQQATATARLAQDQLAFERAEPARTFIATDYWTAPAGRPGKPATDTKGMTGAERLDEDLLQLDQYAFSTDERRLNLAQTFSLAQLMPIDFLGFRRTGQLSFATPMSWFDQDFPGHYQRLIRQVHLSLVALVPPDRGIRASLSNSGISRVTTPDAFGSFTDVVLRRAPGVVSVTSPLNATGVFELDLQPEMLLPFEGGGVDTQWQFTLPRAANPFDFSSIADVLLRIDYTALADADYGTLVMRKLNAHLDRSSDCVFSLARDFPDQWYELNNPGPGASRSTTLTLAPGDFPMNLQGLVTTQIALGLSTTGSGALPAVQISLNRTTRSAPAGGVSVGGVASTDSSGIASTRRGAPAWLSLTGMDPTGKWQLSLDATADPLFTDGQLEDLLLIVSWQGQSPAWPA